MSRWVTPEEKRAVSSTTLLFLEHHSVSEIMLQWAIEFVSIEAYDCEGSTR